MKWCVIAICFVLVASSASAKQQAKQLEKQAVFLGSTDAVVVDEYDNVHRKYSRLNEESFTVGCLDNPLYYPNRMCTSLSFDGISYSLFKEHKNARMFRLQFIKETLTKMKERKNDAQTIQEIRERIIKKSNSEIKKISVKCTPMNKLFVSCSMFFEIESTRYEIDVPKCSIKDVTNGTAVNKQINQCKSTFLKPSPTL
jgi:chromosome segregation ATPase